MTAMTYTDVTAVKGGVTLGEVIALRDKRLAERGSIFAVMKQIIDATNGDLPVALPEINKVEKVAVANKILGTIDAYGQRIADVMFNIRTDPVRPGIKASEDRADARRRAYLGLRDHNKVPLHMGRAGRYFVGLGAAPVMLTYNRKTGLIDRELKHPLQTLPGTPLNPDDPAVPDIIFTFTRTLAWLRKTYPGQAMLYKDMSADTKIELVEYCDDRERLLLCLGQSPGYYDNNSSNPFRADIYNGSSTRSLVCELEHYENTSGLCAAVYPNRITLDRLAGQVDTLIGMYQTEALLMALAVNAALRGVFPEEWLIENPNEEAEIITMADGPKGIIGRIRGGQLQKANLDRSYMTDQTLNLLARNQQVDAKMPSQFGGEAPSGARTGRAQQGIIDAAVDPTIAEAHRAFAASYEQECRISRALLLAHSPDRPRSVHVTSKGGRGPHTFVPSEIFPESDAVECSYPMAGADASTTVLVLGQMTAIEGMSLETMREESPLIRDADLEKHRINREKVENALVAGFQQRVAAGEVALIDAAWVASAVARGTDIIEAIQTADQKARERQASEAPTGEALGPALAGSPEAQLGIEAGPGGAATPVEAPEPSTPDLQGLRNLVGNIVTPQRQVS